MRGAGVGVLGGREVTSRMLGAAVAGRYSVGVQNAKGTGSV